MLRLLRPLVTFLSLLELLKEGLIELAQGEPYSPIHVRAASNVKAVPDAALSSEFDEPEEESEIQDEANLQSNSDTH